MRTLLLALIRLYQRHLSPRKGYGCAYRLHCGGAGCSGLGWRAIRWKGAWAGLFLLRERLARCAAVHARAHPARRLPAAQRGDCDCGGCDTPGGCDLGDACDVGDACDCCDACDVFESKSRRDRRKKTFRGRFS